MENNPELLELLRLRDEDIDTSDIPEVKDWSKAVKGKFYRPLKEAVTIRLDADVIHWLKSNGRGYQTRTNSLLRRCMVSEIRSEHPRRPSEALSAASFPALGKRGDLARCSQVASIIRNRGCFFARAT
jgi:uncharacterized protein (DUF4415 family)